MPQKLNAYLPGVPENIKAQIFGNTVAIVALAPTHPVRLGAIRAYGETMEILLIVATVMSTSRTKDHPTVAHGRLCATGVPPLIIAFFMPNYYLGDAQNAVDGLDITGQKVEDLIEQPATPGYNTEKEKEKPLTAV